MLATAQPIPNLSDLDGTPLESGSIYYGVAGQNPETSPVTVYWDSAGTQPAAQPIRTLGGYPVRNGAPAIVYVSGSYSITIRDRRGQLVLTAPDAATFDQSIIAKAEVDALRADLASADPAKGASLVGYQPLWTGSSAGTVANILAVVPVVATRWPGVDPTGVGDSTTGLQAAINYAIAAGLPLRIPAGRYRLTATLVLTRPSGEYRADAFRIYGDGAGSVFLSYTLCPGTVLVMEGDAPLFTVDERIVGGFNNLYIEHMRLQHIHATTTNPVILCEITAGYSRFAHLEIYHQGAGDGIKVLKGYLTTIEFCNIVNRDLVNFGAGVARVATGVNVVSTQAGGLLTLHKVTSRGFVNAYILGDGTTGIFSTKMDQCECSVVTFGIVVQANMVKTVIDTCYFEAVYNKCVLDRGRATTVRDCFFFSSYIIGIESVDDTHGNVYENNTLYLEFAGSVGIDVKAVGDASGFQKVIRDNHIYFLTSGGTLANVIGVRVTGVNPALSIVDNTFRPRRSWVGGAGTIKVDTSGITGSITGISPLTDTLNEYPLLGNHNISLAPGPATITESSVSAGALTLPVSGSDFTIAPTIATSVTSIVSTGQVRRLIAFTLNNANITFTEGAFMHMDANFTGPGTLFGKIEMLAGVAHFYEYGRSTI